ncbi:MAG: formate dehydrogenase accessory sulfurtransferase FdhD [Chitinophagaceae bacterium]
MKHAIQLPVIKISGTTLQSGEDSLAVEEPLEIRLAYGPVVSRRIHNLAVTMRTPGNDAELAAGFLFTEGIIEKYAAIEKIAHGSTAANDENIILVTLHETVTPNLTQSDRNFYTTSSCGVCGKASINAIRTVRSAVTQPWVGDPISLALINSLPDQLIGQQKIFATTGGLHAATLFNDAGDLLLLREDVGRHNAVDKLIGAALDRTAIDFPGTILLLSGRASFELVQKAAMAGIPVIAAVGAPSSLAVSLAAEFGITLIGFLRNNRFNIYTAAHRIQLPVYENTY